MSLYLVKLKHLDVLGTIIIIFITEELILVLFIICYGCYLVESIYYWFEDHLLPTDKNSQIKMKTKIVWQIVIKK